MSVLRRGMEYLRSQRDGNGLATPICGFNSEHFGAAVKTVLRWGRLPLQALLIWWLVWGTRPRYVLR
jgi:hypothetical protein